MEENLIVPQNYAQWLKVFSVLSSTAVSFDSICKLKQGTCPGLNNVTSEFYKRLQETTNCMLKRITKRCTYAINTLLEEGDFENFEVIIRRYRCEMQNCRFYLYINFLRPDYVQELDTQVVKEIARYWKELYDYLMALVEETDDSKLYDMVYHLKRIK